MHLRILSLFFFLFVVVLAAVAESSHPLQSLGGDWPLYGHAKPRFTEVELQTPEVDAKLRALPSRIAETELALANFMPERALASIAVAEKSPNLDKAERARLMAHAALAYQMGGQYQRGLTLLTSSASSDKGTTAWSNSLREQIKLAEEIVEPLVSQLRTTPQDAELWAQLAEAWTDSLLYCPRNALGASAEALALDPGNTRAKRAEEWAIAQFVHATPGRRRLATGLESELHLNYRPDYFPDEIRQRLHDRLAQPLVNDLVHWVRNVNLLSAMAPSQQAQTAFDEIRTIRQELVDNPYFPNSHLPTFDAILSAYAFRSPLALADLAQFTEEQAGREYFQAELKAMTWAQQFHSKLPSQDAATIRSALSDFETVCGVTVNAMIAGQRHGPNWNLLQPLVERLTEPATFALMSPGERIRLAESMEKIFARQPESVAQLATLANFHATLALASPATDLQFKQRCDGLAMEEFFKLIEHDEVTWQDMIPAALYACRTGRATSAQIVAAKISEFPTVYGIIRADDPTATCRGWLHAGLLHLQVQTDPKIAEAQAKRCFEQAQGAAVTGSTEQLLVQSAQAVLTGRPSPDLRNRLRSSHTDEGLRDALQYRLAAVELIDAINHLAGPLSSARALAWTSPSLNEAIYQTKTNDVVAELKQLPSALLWQNLEHPEKTDFARSVGAMTTAIRDVINLPRPQSSDSDAERVPLIIGTANPDYTKERAALLDVATKTLEGLATLAEAMPMPRGLSAAQFRDRVLPVFAEAVKNLGGDGLPIRNQLIRLESRLALGVVKQATAAHRGDYLVAQDGAVLQILAHIEKQGALPREQIATARQQYVQQRDVIMAHYQKDLQAKQAAEAARQARLAAIPKDPPGVITIRDANGTVTGGLDFRVTEKAPQSTYQPPAYENSSSRDTSRTCSVCNGSGVTYEVTEASNRSRSRCWRCKGKGRLQSYE